MGLTYPYCSVEDLQRETGNSDDQLLQWYEDCINLASRTIDEHCNRDFKYHDYSSTAYTVKRKQVITGRVYLPWPIISLTEVILDDVTVDSDLYYSDNLDRVVELKAGSWFEGSSLTSGVSTIKVKGTFGFVYASTAAPSATLPQQVRKAATLIAAAWSHEKRREKVDSEGQRTNILDERIPTEAMMLLKSYVFKVF